MVEITADSIAPAAPTNLQLELTGAGIKATWFANPDDSYNLYRSETASINNLNPIKTKLKQLNVIDNSPSETAHYYAVTAIDKAGNESEPSNFAYLNFDLLPVSALKIVQDGENPPVLSFQHSKAVKFELQVNNGSKLPLTTNSYIDIGYIPEQTRTYSVIAIDNNEAKSLERTVVLPAVSIQLENTAPLHKSQFNTLIYKVTNFSGDNLTNLKIHAQLGNQTANSPKFALFAGETQTIKIIIGGSEATTLNTTN